MRNNKFIRLLVVLFTVIFSISGAFSAVFAAGDNPSDVTTTSENGTYSFRTVISSTKDDVKIQVYLLKTTNEALNFQVRYMGDSSIDLGAKFDSNKIKIDLGDKVLTEINDPDAFWGLGSNVISFQSATGGTTYATMIPGETGLMFTATLPVKEWDGSEIGPFNITYNLSKSAKFTARFLLAELTDTIYIPAAGSSSASETSNYSAYLKTDAAEVAPGGTYTTDLYMKSDDALSAGEIDLAAANGKITNIALADGIGMTQVDDVSDGKTEAKISFDGNTASAKEGLKIATITVRADENASDTVDLSISQGIAAKTGSTKDQTVTLGEDAKVTVPIIANANCSCESYAAGKYLVKYTGTVAGSEVAKYGEEEMYWSPKYASWVYLTDSDVSQTLRDSRFSSVSGTKKDLTYTGDVNGNRVVNIVDAQVAYDIANSVYSDFTDPTMEQWLMADVNANSMVEASDARAIQVYIHTQSWTDGVH